MIVGLTGSIGSGKSTASKRLAELGAFILDADRISREVVEPGTEALDKIVKAFGRDILSPDGSLNRKTLANKVFCDNNEIAKLNAIIHPAVLEEMYRQTEAIVRNGKAALIVWDVPLLIESGMHEECDYVLVVQTDEDIRIKRVTERDKCTVDEARARMKKQMSDNEKAKYAHKVILNNSDKASFIKAIDEAFAEIMGGMDGFVKNKCKKEEA